MVRSIEVKKGHISTCVMEIIDFAKKGNAIRFYLGKNGHQYGDDWDDYSYEHNAGGVYDEFIMGYKDITFPYDYMVLEPSDCGGYESRLCKNDFVQRKAPCIIVVPKEIWNDEYDYQWEVDDYRMWVGANTPGIIKYYFGTEMEPDVIIEPQEDVNDKDILIYQLMCYTKHHNNIESELITKALSYLG